LSEEPNEEPNEELIGLDLRSLGDRLYLELTLSERSVLMSLDALIDGSPIPTPSLDPVEASAQAVSSHDPIVGPITWGDTRLIMSDGELYIWSEDGLLSPWSETELETLLETLLERSSHSRWTCLTTSSLCTSQEVVTLPRLSDDTLNLIFAHSQLKAPLEEYVSPERWPLCQTEWFDYAIHAGISPSLSRDDELSDLHHPSADASSDTSNTGCYARQRPLEIGSTSDFSVITALINALIMMLINVLYRRQRHDSTATLHSDDLNADHLPIHVHPTCQPRSSTPRD
jgi:hypothetical protein